MQTLIDRLSLTKEEQKIWKLIELDNKKLYGKTFDSIFFPYLSEIKTLSKEDISIMKKRITRAEQDREEDLYYEKRARIADKRFIEELLIKNKQFDKEKLAS